MSKKLYHLQSHLTLTVPDAKTGFCKLGLTEYALKYFVRFNKVDFSDYPKTKYGITNSSFINLFVKETFSKYVIERITKEEQKQD